MSDLKLYSYWRSSASWRVRWALALKEVSFRYIPVNLLTGEHTSPEHLKVNPQGSVPVLELGDGRRLAQSLPIVEWIEESYAQGPALFPKNPWEKARVRTLCEIINADTAPLQMPRTQKAHSADPQEQSAWAQGWIRRGLQNYASMSAQEQGHFSFGDEITAADLFLIPQVYNALRYQIDMASEFPQLFHIYERARATEACKKAEPELQSDAPAKPLA